MNTQLGDKQKDVDKLKEGLELYESEISACESTA